MNGDLMTRIPPRDLDAECAVLGAVFLDNRVLEDVSDILNHTDFYQGSHSKIFQAMLSLAARTEPIDGITMNAELQGRGWLEEIGGAGCIAEIVASVPNAVHASFYAKVVRDRARLREFITTSRG